MFATEATQRSRRPCDRRGLPLHLLPFLVQEDLKPKPTSLIVGLASFFSPTCTLLSGFQVGSKYTPFSNKKVIVILHP